MNKGASRPPAVTGSIMIDNSGMPAMENPPPDAPFMKQIRNKPAKATSIVETVTASGFAFAAAQRMMGDGTAELARLKRLDALARQKLAADRLSGFEIKTNEKSYHLWLTLPAHWRSQTFVAAAARRDNTLTP